MISIDVIIPFHKEPNKFLFAAIESIEESRKVCTNVILVDDRANPIEKFHPNSKIMYLKSGGIGYPGALNLAKQNLTSEYVAFLNSDDLSHPDRLRLQIRSIQERGAKIALGGVQKFGVTSLSFDKLGLPPRAEYSKVLLLLGAYGADASLVTTTSWLYDKNWESGDMADWGFALQYYPLNDEVTYCADATYFYRIHKSQITRNQRSLPLSCVEAWLKLNSTYGLPTLTKSVITNVATPFIKNKISYQEATEIVFWFTSFLKTAAFDFREESSLVSIRKMVASRLLGIASQHPILSIRKSDLKSELGSKLLIESGINLATKMVFSRCVR